MKADTTNIIYIWSATKLTLILFFILFYGKILTHRMHMKYYCLNLLM
uniref:Uncharacterized protein n=1 Tax=Anguilla anguilla TaxID=7936 RepID=A0A0E9T8Q1_ANGAN